MKERVGMCPDHPGSKIGSCGHYVNKPHNWTPEKELPSSEKLAKIRESFIQQSLSFARLNNQTINLEVLHRTAMTLFPDPPIEK